MLLLFLLLLLEPVASWLIHGTVWVEKITSKSYILVLFFFQAEHGFAHRCSQEDQEPSFVPSHPTLEAVVLRGPLLARVTLTASWRLVFLAVPLGSLTKTTVEYLIFSASMKHSVVNKLLGHLHNYIFAGHARHLYLSLTVPPSPPLEGPRCSSSPLYWVTARGLETSWIPTPAPSRHGYFM